MDAFLNSARAEGAPLPRLFIFGNIDPAETHRAAVGSITVSMPGFAGRTSQSQLPAGPFTPYEAVHFPIAQHSHEILQDAACFPALHGWTKPMGAGSALVTRVLLFVARRQSSARTCSLTRRLEEQMKHAQRSCVCGRPCL